MTMSDAVTAIERDHRELDALLERVLAGEGERDALLTEVAARLSAHSRAEELEVYPYLTDHEENEREHFQAEHLLRRARNLTASPHFEEAFGAFVAAVRRHVREEESTVLPRLVELVDAATLDRLGTAFEAERVRLLGPPVGGKTRDELYQQARKADLPGRSHMNKEELAEALGEPT
jgi:hemerythrin superfamily protein